VVGATPRRTLLTQRTRRLLIFLQACGLLGASARPCDVARTWNLAVKRCGSIVRREDIECSVRQVLEGVQAGLGRMRAPDLRTYHLTCYEGRVRAARRPDHPPER
jgi:hypothetical protein